MWNSLKRVIKTGLLDFSRSLGSSIATIFIMTMVVLLISALFLMIPISRALISDIQDKIDVSVYFKKDTALEDIFQLQNELSKLPDVKSAEYVSKDQALANFLETHKNDQAMLDALKEVGDNPFLASLNVKAEEASQYEQVATFLDGPEHKEIVEKVDYFQRKPLIDKVFSVISWLNWTGLITSIILGIIAFLVAFNTVKLAIYSSSDEIKTMRLVGATNWFVRGPFLAQGVLIGLIAALISLIVTTGICLSFSGKVQSIISSVSLTSIFFSNLFLLILTQLVAGIGIGAISSFVAIRKFLGV